MAVTFLLAERTYLAERTCLAERTERTCLAERTCLVGCKPFCERTGTHPGGCNLCPDRKGPSYWLSRLTSRVGHRCTQIRLHRVACRYNSRVYVGLFPRVRYLGGKFDESFPACFFVLFFRSVPGHQFHTNRLHTVAQPAEVTVD